MKLVPFQLVFLCDAILLEVGDTLINYKFSLARSNICDIAFIIVRVGSFLASWLLGTFLMVSVMPPLLQGPRSLEVSTSLICCHLSPKLSIAWSL